MTSIVITEKPSQARNVAAAVKNAYGPIFPASGHIIRIKLPGEQNPAWKSWTYDLLMPPGGTYDFVPDDTSSYKKKVLGDILAALSKAKTVYIATDCDREGQLIGEEILTYAGFKGQIMRVMFTAEDPVTLQKAFQQAKPNSHYRNLYGAGFARLQGDQIYNLTLTRVATKALGDPKVKKAIGIGRVKTPTLGIVCARELEIANFKAEDYFEIIAT
ncbi:MAG: DNA topoisomerase III, partial [Phreatobacter sp.]|nr:DNA topoisomerase III [Phreatobacter sp.]